MFASVVLYSWPLVVMVLFQKYRTTLAILVSVIAGYLLLPAISGLDLPLLPTFDKTSIPALAAALFAFLALRKRDTEALKQWVPRSWMARFMLLALVVGAFLTVLTNTDRTGFIQGLRVYDGFSAVLGILIMLLPFILAYRFAAAPAQQRLILIVFAVAGFAYSFLALYEIRASPQLNNMVYGFFPHSWMQHVRSGGFRPLVFLDHGLWLAIFLAMSVVAAIGAAAAVPARRKQFLWMAAWIMMTILLSNSLGAAVIALALAPIAFFLPQRTQMLAALVIGSIVLTYPVLRERGLVTGGTAVSLASKIDAERASSLQFRLDNENILLAKANDRPLFGWGGWGRARVYDENGQDISVTDGYWVIIFGVGGWTRYIGEFGLMVTPLILLYVRRKRFVVGPETTTLAIVLCVNLLDLIPNGTMTPLTWLVAGALWGRLEWQGQDGETGDGNAIELAPQPISPYTRQTKRINRRQAQ